MNTTKYLDKNKCNNYDKPSIKYGDYYIIKEGFKTFTVEYAKNSIKIYENIYLSEKNKKENTILQKYLKQNKPYETTTQFGSGKDDDYIYFFPKIKMIKQIKQFINVWIGFDTENKGRSRNYFGNSILIQTKLHNYIHIYNYTIYQFVSKDQIVKYYSPLDDETICNPVAISKNKIFIFIPFKNIIETYNIVDINKIPNKIIKNKEFYLNDFSKNTPMLFITLYDNKVLSHISSNKTIKAKVLHKSNIS